MRDSYAALRRGARLLANGFAPAPRPPRALSVKHDAKVLGNGLRELDRLLNVLLDQLGQRCAAAIDPGQRNTANKLDRLCRHLGVESGDRPRLLALGRSRDCLFYCAGRVVRGDVRHADRMTAGWPGAEPHLMIIGESINLSPAELAEICDYYVALAYTLLRAVLRHDRRLVKARLAC